MLIKAQSKFIRQSPRKLRLVADLIRSMSVDQALLTLKHLPQRAAVPLHKTLKQAQANAVNNHNQPKDSLTLHSLEINEGPTYKRWQPVSRGRAHSIFKRTSHIKIVLSSPEPTPPVAKSKPRPTSKSKPKSKPAPKTKSTKNKSKTK